MPDFIANLPAAAEAVAWWLIACAVATAWYCRIAVVTKRARANDAIAADAAAELDDANLAAAVEAWRAER